MCSNTVTFTKKQLTEFVQEAFQEFTEELVNHLWELGQGKSQSEKVSPKPKSEEKAKKKTQPKSKEKSKPKKKTQPKSEESLKKKAQDLVNAKKTKAQSYYDVSSGKTYTASASKKKTHDFFKLGEPDDLIYLMGEKDSDELKSALEELGFPDAEPVGSQKKLPKKKAPVKKSTKSPVKKPAKKKSPVKPKVIIDEENHLAKDEEGFVYIPSSKGQKLTSPLVFGKLEEEEVVPLTDEDIKKLDARSI